MSRSDSARGELETKPGATLAELRAQILARAAREPAPTRAQFVARQRVVVGLALGISLLVFLAWGGLRPDPRPAKLVLETVAGSSALAIGIAIVALGRGRSMVGRPRPWLALVVTFTPIALFAWRVLMKSPVPWRAVPCRDLCRCVAGRRSARSHRCRQ